MALLTFTPPVRPSPGTQMKPKVNLYEAEFGDGYTLAAPRGLNHIAQTAALKWNGLDLTQLQTIEAFFSARKGYQAFYFQPWGYAAMLKWTCKDWSWSSSAPYTFSANLVQSFTLET